MTTQEFKDNFLPLHRKLYAVALLIMSNEADAADIVQDAYFRLWKERHRLQKIRNAEAYAITLTRNLCFDVMRQRQRHPEDVLYDNTEIPYPSSEPINEEEHLEQIKRVKKLIDSLPKRQREIIMLRDIQQLSFDEIVSRTHLSPTNIRATLSKARQRIRQEFSKP